MSDDSDDIWLLIAFTLALGSIVGTVALRAWSALWIFVPLSVATIAIDIMRAKQKRRRRHGRR